MNQIDLQAFLSERAELPRTTTLFRETGMRTLLLHLKPGENIPQHQTRGAITVHCLKGEARFFIGDEAIQLRPALLISLPPATPHSVVAEQDTLLLVTVSEQIAPAGT
jgi:quercetin dioxygenase-like cupin family protein